jgi:hypothetical protein
MVLLNAGMVVVLCFGDVAMHNLAFLLHLHIRWAYQQRLAV